VGAFICRSIICDEFSVWQGLSPLISTKAGVIENIAEILAVENLIRTPSIIVRRDAYETIGGFNLELSYTSDWEMWQRIALHYPIWYDPQPLTIYREHSKSDTFKLMRTGENIQDLFKCAEIIYDQLPKESRNHLLATAQQRIMGHGIEAAYRFAKNKIGVRPSLKFMPLFMGLKI
ncbi:MAG: hypothetical protein HC796_06110, partial [Synechococcaceae cyanobacterium RL_1_2]|nr:hypothetical protein [Synechococcaceae cyanobacterium RL_1_2]